MDKNVENEESGLSDALMRYEMIREDVFKELCIKHVQQLVTSKLLNKSVTEIDLFFYKEENDVIDSESEDKTVSTYSENSRESEEISQDEEESVEKDLGKPNPMIVNSKSFKSSDYLNLEADCSADEDEEDEDEDLNGLIDDSCSDNIQLDKYNDEMFKTNEKILKNLENKFIKKPKVVKSSSRIENDLFVSSSEEFPEIKVFELESERIIEENAPNKKVVEKSKINQSEPHKNESIFNNDVSAYEKLIKGDEKKPMGFISKNNNI